MRNCHAKRYWNIVGRDTATDTTSASEFIPIPNLCISNHNASKHPDPQSVLNANRAPFHYRKDNEP